MTMFSRKLRKYQQSRTGLQVLRSPGAGGRCQGLPELTVSYDYNRQRMSSSAVIQAQQREGVSIPAQATNVHITAKAIAGQKILDVTVPTARSLCYEVRVGTWTTRWAYCPQ